MALVPSSPSALFAGALLVGACAHAPQRAAHVPPIEAQRTTESDVIGGRELVDAVAASSAVVVATARVVDERGGLKKPPYEGGETLVVLTIEQVLFGAAKPGELELWIYGGVLPDGTILGHSNAPPDLTDGDRYVLFLRDAPQARDPFVRFRYAVLRIVRFGEEERVVDEGGHGIVADPRGGLRRIGKISEAMRERSIAKAREEGSGAVYVSQDRLVPADIERTSPLRDVLSAIVRATGNTGR